MLTSITTNKTSALTIRRILNAPVERVYKAWTNPAQIKKWFGCEYVTDIELQQDLTVGGSYEVKMTTAPDSVVVTINGVFKEIEPNRKLVYTWTTDSAQFPAEDTLVTVEFVEVAKGTEIVLTHSNFVLESSAQGHSIGWTSSLNHIVDMCEQAK